MAVGYIDFLLQCTSGDVFAYQQRSKQSHTLGTVLTVLCVSLTVQQHCAHSLALHATCYIIAGLRANIG